MTFVQHRKVRAFEPLVPPSRPFLPPFAASTNR